MERKIISARVHPTLRAKIKEYARKDKKTLSEWLRAFLEKAIK